MMNLAIQNKKYRGKKEEVKRPLLLCRLLGDFDQHGHVFELHEQHDALIVEEFGRSDEDIAMAFRQMHADNVVDVFDEPDEATVIILTQASLLDCCRVHSRRYVTVIARVDLEERVVAPANVLEQHLFRRDHRLVSELGDLDVCGNGGGAAVRVVDHDEFGGAFLEDDAVMHGFSGFLVHGIVVVAREDARAFLEECADGVGSLSVTHGNAFLFRIIGSRVRIVMLEL